MPTTFQGVVERLGKACPVREMMSSLVSPVQPPYNLLRMGGFVQQDAAMKSRPEIEIADQRLAFSTQTPSYEPSYKTAPKPVHVKCRFLEKCRTF
jgi:hypothetical protein